MPAWVDKNRRKDAPVQVYYSTNVLGHKSKMDFLRLGNDGNHRGHDAPKGEKMFTAESRVVRLGFGLDAM